MQNKQLSPLFSLYYNREVKEHIFLQFSHTPSFRTKIWQLTFYSKKIKTESNRRPCIMPGSFLPRFPSF